MPGRRSLALSLLVAVALGTGCIAIGDDVPTTQYDFGLFPNMAYSGFNGTASFKVMFATGAEEPIEWKVEDESVATIAPSDAPVIAGTDVTTLKFALVTTKKAGETKVMVTSRGQTRVSQLTVKGYTDGQIALGKMRYEVGSADPGRASCASCHQKPGGVDHSPLKMAGFDDPTILGVIQNATYPANATGQSTTSAFAPTGPLMFTGHKWNLTDPEKDAILAHLRSLPLGGVK